MKFYVKLTSHIYITVKLVSCQGGVTMDNRVRKYRNELGLTQKELAEKAGVSSRTIISLEKGSYKPSILLAYKLSLIFGENMEKIFKLYENMLNEDKIKNK